MVRKATRSLLMVTAGLMSLCLTGCFTGVEGTGRINLSKKDLIAVAPTEEDILLSGVGAPKLKDWQKGKLFLIADDKFRLVVENPRNVPITPGDVISFAGAESLVAADGGERTIILFDLKGDRLTYAVEQPLASSLENIVSGDVPMTIDLDLVAGVKEKLAGKTLWTKSALWYDDSLQYKKGKKFKEVSVTDVTPGNSFFPLLVKFVTKEGERGALLMNIGNSGNESRNFGKLFSLTDPKNNYKHISPEHWEAIQGEELRIGMTKEESRLSRGNPSDVDTGHNYSNAMEIWYYPDGRYLQFVDGLLVRFK